MANYALTKKVIDDNIRRNGRRAITGPVLNAVLNQMLSTLGIGGYKLGGVVSPDDTFIPGDADMFFVATQPGTYADFGGFVLNEGEIGFLSFNGEWHNTAVSAGGSVDAYTKAESDEKFATNDALAAEISERQVSHAEIYNDLGAEVSRAESAESAISARVDAIVQGKDVRDIVGSYAELEAYDTSTLGDNDIVMVLLDSTKSGHTTYYRWKQAEGEWDFIGGLAFTYTKTEIDDKFRALHIVLPTIPADAEAHPENYQELLAQVDTMVRGAGADASFKMPIADVGNVDVTFVKTNPANVYLGVFADDRSYLYQIIRTITTPRTYTCHIVQKIFAEADKIVITLPTLTSETPSQDMLREVYETVKSNSNAVFRFENGIVVASVKVENQPAPFEPSVILRYYDDEYIRTLTIDKVMDDDVVEYLILRRSSQLAPMASLTQLENNVVKLNGNQSIGGTKSFERIEIIFDQLVDEDSGVNLYNALATLEPKHYVATYRDTTYADVKSAIEAGKEVLVKFNDALFHLTHVQADKILFGGVYSFVLYNITIDNTDKWSVSTASISKSITDYVGDKTTLTTEDKSTLVAGINENAGKLTALQTKVREKAKVTPTLTSGTQIATITTENAEGQAVETPLYAPQGSGSGEDKWEKILDFDLGDITRTVNVIYEFPDISAYKSLMLTLVRPTTSIVSTTAMYVRYRNNYRVIANFRHAGYLRTTLRMNLYDDRMVSDCVETNAYDSMNVGHIECGDGVIFYADANGMSPAPVIQCVPSNCFNGQETLTLYGIKK